MLKVTELFSKAILLSMFVYEIAWLCADLIRLSATGVAGISEFHSFVGVSTHFCINSSSTVPSESIHITLHFVELQPEFNLITFTFSLTGLHITP
jgi:hypothetical protein